jgi:Ca-activated chloride channel family protein
LSTYIFVVILLITSSLTHPLAYDSAIYKAQKGNWQDAHTALNNIITDNPDNADVMYDAGVAAYNVGNTCQAAICFARATECNENKNVCFRAHYNAGNMCVEEKKLKNALAEYDKALAIEPDNEYARHNRDRVAQMLEEEKNKQNQQQNEQDQQDNKQDNQDKKDPSSAKPTEDTQNQDGNDDQQQNGEQKQDGNDQSSSAEAPADKQSGGNDKQNQNGNDKKSNDNQLDQKSQSDHEQQTGAEEQRTEQGNEKKEHQKNSDNNKKRNGKDQLDKQSKEAQKEEGNKQHEGNKHNITPEQANTNENNKNNVATQDGQEQGEACDALDEMVINDPWLLKVLNDQEKRDKVVNKQLMEAKIRQHGGKNGQNCW